MKNLIIALSFLLIWTSNSAQFTDLGVALFDYRDYEGQHIFIDEDWTADDKSIPFGIESVRIPKGWEVWLYEGSNFTGRHRTLIGSWDGNGSKDWQWRNDIRSVRLVSKFQANPYLQSLRTSQGIAIFKDRDFRGDHKFITRDWTQVDGCLAYGIESIRIPTGWEVWIYEGDNFTGRHKKLTEDWDGEAYDDWRWRNDIRSIRIIRSNISWNALSPEIPEVTLYDGADHNGESFSVNGEWTVLNSTDEWNDRINSIEIPDGFEVHIFEHARYRGKMKILKRDWRADESWKDRVSSIRVFNTGYVQR